jgi:hypothetical protein
MGSTIHVRGNAIRTDWISRIERSEENGSPTCTIWLCIGPVGFYSFTGTDAETALELLAKHPALVA